MEIDMTLSHPTTKVPLRTEPDGTVRVGGTRVALEVIFGAFNNGSTCEEIVLQFPVLLLGDVYAVIGFYLNNKNIVEQYLNRQDAAAEQIRQSVSAQFSQQGDIRQGLMRRRNDQHPASS